MKQKINIKYHHVLLIASIIALIPIVVLCFYDRPMSDDYSYGLFTHYSYVNNPGVLTILQASWQYAKEEYMRWVGSFLCTMIGSLHPGIFGGKFYVLAPIIVLIWMYICIRYTIGIINKLYIKKSKIVSITLSLWILSFFLMWMPTISEGIYWFCGASVYTISFFAILLNIGLLIKISNENNKKTNIFFTILSCIVSFLAADGHIMVSFSSVIILFPIVIFFLLKKKFNIIPSYLVCLIRFLFNVFSPGLAQRSELIVEQTFSFFTTIKRSFYYSRNFITSNINLVLFLFLLSLTPFIIDMIRNQKENKCSYFKIIFVFLLTFLILSGISCVPVYTSKFIPRVINIVWWIFVILMIIDYYFLVEYLYINKIVNFDILNKSKATILVALFCLVIIFGNSSGSYYSRSSFIRAKDELTSEIAMSYAKEFDEREEIFLNSKNKDVVVKPLYATPEVLYYDDIGHNKDDWKNKAIANYYDLKSVSAIYE